MSYIGQARKVIGWVARHLHLLPPKTAEKPISSPISIYCGKTVVARPIPRDPVPEAVHDAVVSKSLPDTFVAGEQPNPALADTMLAKAADSAPGGKFDLSDLSFAPTFAEGPAAVNQRGLADTVPAAFLYNAGVEKKPEIPPPGECGRCIRIDGQVFIVGKLISRGGEGEVYRGLQLIEGQESRRVVIKFSHRPGVNMKEEAEVTAKVGNGKSRHIIKYVAHNDECLILEYVESSTLEEHIKSNPRMPLKQTLAVAMSACEALEHAAAVGLSHRDLKPGNIMFDPETGAVTLFDFGVAARYAASLQQGKTMGSLHYCDPCQLAGNQRGDLSDQYSLGLVIGEMLMGQDPISMRLATDQTPPEAESLAARYYRLHTTMELSPDPSIPPVLLPILRRMTASEEGQRYPDWPQVRLAFAQASSTLGIQLMN